jgi:hypothetical protein
MLLRNGLRISGSGTMQKAGMTGRLFGALAVAGALTLAAAPAPAAAHDNHSGPSYGYNGGSILDVIFGILFDFGDQYDHHDPGHGHGSPPPPPGCGGGGGGDGYRHW